MEVQLKIIGGILFSLSFVHLVFPKKFNWKQELATISLMNRQLMLVHTFFVALVVFLMGLLCICCSEEIVHTPFGKKIALGLCIFWFIRLIFQFFVYSPQLWKGKKFETSIHILFSILWIYLTTVFFLIYYNQG